MSRSRLAAWIDNHRVQLLLAAVVLLALWFRFYRLSELPPGLHPDEAANGLDVFRILEQQDFRPLYNTNGPREALFFYLQAASVALLGNTALALRLVPAIVGSLAVGATYLWVRDWFGRRLALLAALLMAVSPWAVNFSRVGFRASLIPLFIPLTLWLYTKALRRGGLWPAAAGASLGLGFYTYLAWRLFPLALAVGGVWWALAHRDRVKTVVKPVAISLVSALIVLTPMLIFAVHHSGDVFGRVTGTSFLNPELNQGQPLQTLGDTILKTGLMFNVHGDDNFRHNLGGVPMLNFFVGIMFLFGLVIALTKLRRPAYAMLIVLFGVMLLPEVLTAEGIPHALRAIGVIPVVYVLAALGINYLLQRWYTTFPLNHAARNLGLTMVCVLLLLTVYHGYRQYFVAWGNHPQTYEAFSEDATAIADYLKVSKFEGQHYVVLDGYSDKTLQYLAHGHRSYIRAEAKDLESASIAEGPKLFLVAASQPGAIAKLRQRFTAGHLGPYDSLHRDTVLFFTYRVDK